MTSVRKFSFFSMKTNLSVLFKDAVLKDKFQDFLKSARPYFTAVSDNDVRNVVEFTVREVLLEFLAMKVETKILDRVLQFSIDAAIQDICPGNLPVLVLSDMFDVSTLSECETIFAFVENRVETFKRDIFFRACKNHLLRSCNDLLRRLSRSQNTVFCGRILLFLARIFPLSERSGLNIISEFNLENTTIYSSKDDRCYDSALDKDDAIEEGEISTRPITTDYNLYQKFWSLQDFFRNPNTCYNKMHWRHFASYTSDILTVFGSFKSDDANSSKWKLPEVSSSSGISAYFAKYLTSPKLLELELSDSNFRRYLLIQFLILFQYLSSPVKFKLETFLLSDEQQTWVKETTKKVYKLLDETPSDGSTFSANVAKILKREEYWNTWKNEGCPDFKCVDDKIDQKIARPKRKRLGDEIDESNNKVFVGTAELTKIWNISPNNWDACKSSKRKFVPSMESFFETAIEQADPANQIESRYKDVNDSKFAWKALRLLCMKSSHFFTVSTTTTPCKNLADYLESMIQKIPKERTNETTIVEAETNAEDSLEDGNDELLPTSEEDSKEEDKLKKNEVVSKLMIEALAQIEKLQSNWKLLAKHLDFQEDEVSYFEETYPNQTEQIEHMLTIWMEQDPNGGSLVSFKSALQSTGILNFVLPVLQAF